MSELHETSGRHSSELRHDRLAGRTVIVAAGRAARPHQFASSGPDEQREGDCVFCPGHEQKTPPETARVGDGTPGSPGWRVRVFPNLFPIVGGRGAGPGATGVHEVIALSPEHSRSLGALDDREVTDVFLVLRDRVRTHLDDGHAFALAIVNHRRAAGASIAHPHAQVLAIDFVPPEAKAALARVAAAGSDLVLLDADAGTAVLEEADAETSEAGGHTGAGRAAHATGTARAWSPYAASSPALVRVAHTHGGPSFAHATDLEVTAVARATREVLARLSSWLSDPAYNLVVHTAPPGVAPGAFHWYVEITPRVSVIAGFEQGTGVFVNSLPPEQAAIELMHAAS
jgi:UDPglucose--hexose-1-phosphate uridylyltransferase